MINDLPLNFFAGQISPDERARIFRKFIIDLRQEFTSQRDRLQSNYVREFVDFLLTGVIDFSDTSVVIDMDVSPILLEL